MPAGVVIITSQEEELLRPFLESLSPLQGTGEISAGLLIDGLMARDLSCPSTAKHAFILRPLPTRAERLQQFASTQRAEMLRYTALRPAAQRYFIAPVQMCSYASTVNGHDSIHAIREFCTSLSCRWRAGLL